MESIRLVSVSSACSVGTAAINLALAVQPRMNANIRESNPELTTDGAGSAGPSPEQFNSRVQRFPERISSQSLDSQEAIREQCEIGLQVSCLRVFSVFRGSPPPAVAAEPL